jgi:hypothetical protein
MIKFSEVKIGQKFVFSFDMNRLGEYYYSYEKVSDNQVKCLTCPKTENCVDKICPFNPQNAKCILIF